MKTLRSIRRSALLACAALTMFVVACSDGGFEPPAGLVGTWNATALVVDGLDLMDEGMTLRFTFTEDAEYSYTVTGDMLDFCEVGPGCSDGGDFSTTSNQITFDPGSTDEETFSFTIAGDVLTVTATIDGSLFVFTFEKV